MSDRAMLTQAQSEALRERGYVPVDAFLAANELHALRAIFDRLFAAGAEGGGDRQFDPAGGKGWGALKLPQILEPSQYAPELLDPDVVRRAREKSFVGRGRTRRPISRPTRSLYRANT